MELVIRTMVQATSINGLPADLWIEAQATKRAPVKRFGVVFSEKTPEGDFGAPILWVNQGVPR